MTILHSTNYLGVFISFLLFEIKISCQFINMAKTEFLSLKEIKKWVKSIDNGP